MTRFLVFTPHPILGDAAEAQAQLAEVVAELAASPAGSFRRQLAATLDGAKLCDPADLYRHLQLEDAVPALPRPAAKGGG